MSTVHCPLVTVCIANYSGEHLLRDCIDSVLAQDLKADVEIIVHDDASSDGSLALLREHYPEVGVITSAKNVGFCVANNRMVAAATGKYVLLLNNDAALRADALGTLVKDSLDQGDGAILTLPQYDWRTGASVDRGCLLDPFHVPIPNLDPERKEVAYVIGACLWIPRETWQRLGGFPEWFGSIAEDMYLCCAARLHGIPVRCVQDSGYLHWQGVSFGGNRVGIRGLGTRYRRRYLSERNRLAVLAMCVPTPLVQPWLALHVLVLVLEGLILSLLVRDSRIWREIYGAALTNAWQARALLMRQRTVVQAARTAQLRQVMAPYRWIPQKLVLFVKYGLPKLS